MDTIRKILIPIDFSNHSTRVLQLAAELCRKHEASATLLHVWDPLLIATPPNEQFFNPRSMPPDASHFALELENAKHALLAAGALRVDVSLEHGRADREIVEFASAGRFDLIVMGTHGRTGLSHVLIGSIAERVVRRAPCPVMTVRMNGDRPASTRHELNSKASQQL
jgi:nucleotide-binding universal stress UspA family protein